MHTPQVSNNTQYIYHGPSRRLGHFPHLNFPLSVLLPPICSDVHFSPPFYLLTPALAYFHPQILLFVWKWLWLPQMSMNVGSHMFL